jgi:hypothetical protein
MKKGEGMELRPEAVKGGKVKGMKVNQLKG